MDTNFDISQFDDDAFDDDLLFEPEELEEESDEEDEPVRRERFTNGVKGNGNGSMVSYLTLFLVIVTLIVCIFILRSVKDIRRNFAEMFEDVF